MIAGAKRGRNERKGLHSWHPYYAGYSESFVASVLQAEGVKSSATVLDPWMGSGTTGIVCQKQTIKCIGADINPVMSYFAAAKSRDNISALDYTGEQLLERILLCFRKKTKDITESSKGYPLIEQLQKFYKCICDQFMDKGQNDIVNPLKAFYCSVLFYTVRNVLDVRSTSNPTWISKKVDFNNKFDICFEYNKNFKIMREQLSEYYGSANGGACYSILNVDSKKLNIKSNTIDLVITSPPYLTRIDYAVSTRLELEIILGSEGYKSLRKEMMGTTTVPKVADEINKKWGPLCMDVLSSVTSHTSRASGSYYLKNKIRYFSDAYESLMEIFRVLKVGCSGYFVIQNSYYKEIEIPLYDIYCEMALSIGFSEAKCVREDQVKAIFGQINTKSKNYIKDKVYFEKIIRITK
ncbi:TPA: DNA methyltransferase [Escherichia coli]|jgi:DNA methylase.|nr:DNA methyltransferase [Escherichia coli]EGM8834345.1 site-specific DNA-methyltransferase [Escherichia albertii]AUG91935.1 hypothetical protein MS8345_00288 [Escherichia coli]EAB8220304.1 hypothetical protein [Escherichia coli]EAC1483672.1 hypothetical protein [Escherichia coli]EEW2575192.1 hypothetical protein [Escherichia coli]